MIYLNRNRNTVGKELYYLTTESVKKSPKIQGWWDYYTESWYSPVIFIIKFFHMSVPIIISIPIVNKYFNTTEGIVVLMIFFLLIFIFNHYEISSNMSEIEKMKNKSEELESENKRLTNLNESLTNTKEQLPEDFIRIFFEDLKLKPYERISLYIFEEDVFTIVGRWSPTKKYRDKVREKYPNDEGFIAKAWNEEMRNGKRYYHKLNLRDPKVDEAQYIEEIRMEANISADTIKRLTMKSRSYYVRSIRKEPTGASNGVVVIESTNSRFSLGIEEMNNMVEERLLKYLHKLLESSLR